MIAAAPRISRDASPDQSVVLTAAEVHARLTAAVRDLHAAERNVVLWFAEVMNRGLYRELGYGSIHRYAAEALGFSAARTSQFIRLASTLDRLPVLRSAVRSGAVPWTKAREVSRVATPETDARWTEAARSRSRGSLEREIRELQEAAGRARRRKRAPGQLAIGDAAGEGRADEATTVAVRHARPDGAAALSPDVTATRAPEGPPTGSASPGAPTCSPEELPVHVGVRLDPPDHARFIALMERLQKLGVRGSREAVVLAALEALVREEERESRRESGGRTAGQDAESSSGAVARAGESSRRAVDPEGESPGLEARDRRAPSRPSHRIVITVCPKCDRASRPGGPRDGRVTAAELDAALCDAEVVAPDRRTRSVIPPGLRAQVLRRDGHRCRSAGCGNARFLEVHHVVPRERGGTNAPENLITLCSGCPRATHRRGSVNAVPRRGVSPGKRPPTSVSGTPPRRAGSRR